MYPPLCTMFSGSQVVAMVTMAAQKNLCECWLFSLSLLTTDAADVTDYGLQVFTLDSTGALTVNHDTLFPDAVNCLHTCMHAILYYMITYVYFVIFEKATLKDPVCMHVAV